MNELDKLRTMLTEAKIPFESYEELYEDRFKDFPSCMPNIECDADRYFTNQVIYGRGYTIDHMWIIDAIYKYGSYGRASGLLETYGEMGVDYKDNPKVMSAVEVFDIIKNDWEKRNLKTV